MEQRSRFYKLTHATLRHVNVSDLVVLLAISTLALGSINLFGGQELIWGDDSQVPLNLHTSNERYWSAWDPNLGRPDPVKFAFLVPVGLVLKLIDLFGIPYSAAVFERLSVYFLFVLSGVSMYLLFISITREGECKRIGAFSAATFYMFNFYVMLTIWNSLAYLFFRYAFFPLVLALYITGLRENKGLQYAVVTAIVWTVTVTPAYVTTPMALLDWAAIFLYLIYSTITCGNRAKLRKGFSFTFAMGATWTTLNLFWIVPTLLLSNSIISATVPLSRGLLASQSVPLNEGVRLMGYLGLQQGYRGEAFYPWYKLYTTSYFILLSYLPPILASFGLLTKHGRKENVFFALMAISAVFFAKGVNPPFGQIAVLLASNKIVEVALRSPYQRFIGYVALAYSPLIGSCLMKVLCLDSMRSMRKSLIRLVTVFGLLFLMGGVFLWPFWNGDIYASHGIIVSRRITVPSEYVAASDWLNGQTEEFAVLPLPFPARTNHVALSWANGSGGYNGVYPLVLMSGKRFLLDNDAAASVVTQIIDGKINDAVVLNLLDIKYVVLNLDTNWAYISGNSYWISTSPSSLVAALGAIRGLILERSFGPLHFYRNTYWRPMHVYATNSDIALVFASVPNDGAYVHNDSRLPIRISNPGKYSLSNYQLRLNLTYIEGMRTDFHDVRLAYYNISSQKMKELPIWIEQKSDRHWAVLWTKIPVLGSSGTSLLYAYYGGTLSDARQSPSSVFGFFDDFSDGNLSKWSYVGGNCSLDRSRWIGASGYSAKCQGPPSSLIVNLAMSRGTYEGWFMFADNNTDHFPFLPSDELGKWNYWVVAKADGHFGYYDGSSYKDFPIRTEYEPFKWYFISITFDFSVQKFWVSVNGELKTPDGLFTVNDNGVSGSRLVNLRIQNSRAGEEGTMWIGLVRVRAGDSDVKYSIGSPQDVSFQIISPVEAFEKLDMTEYRSRLSFERPVSFLLILSEPYDDGWKVSVNGQVLSVDQRFLAFGYQNGWRVSCPRECALSVFYEPQRLINSFITISIILLGMVIVVLLSSCCITTGIFRGHVLTDDQIRKSKDFETQL